ncbi:hypothetical protein ISCGN_024151 [Ixodes scapularis]
MPDKPKPKKTTMANQPHTPASASVVYLPVAPRTPAPFHGESHEDIDDWVQHQATYNRTRFLVTLLVVFRMDIFWVFVVTSAYYGCLIARIPILESLISDSSSLQTDTLAVLFLATCVGDSLLSCYQLHLCMRLAQRIRSILQAAMFQKAG